MLFAAYVTLLVGFSLRIVQTGRGSSVWNVDFCEDHVDCILPQRCCNFVVFNVCCDEGAQPHTLPNRTFPPPLRSPYPIPAYMYFD